MEQLLSRHATHRTIEAAKAIIALLGDTARLERLLTCADHATSAATIIASMSELYMTYSGYCTFPGVDGLR